MRTRIVTLGMLTLLSTVALSLAQRETATARFDRGRIAENTKGLEAAIPIYESILRDFPNDRANSARALVRLGRDYDLLGQFDKSRQYLQQVVDRFSDQTADVAEARRLLNGLPSPPQLRIHLFVAEMDPRTGTVRQPVQITEDPGIDEAYPTFSPDGKSIAFRRFPKCCGNGSLVERALDTKLEQITKTTPCGMFGPGPSRWLDGKSLLAVVRSSTRDSCVLRYDIENGLTVEMLMTAGSDLIANYSTLSPDGTTLYADQGRPGSRSAPITVVRALDLVTRQSRQVYELPFLQGRIEFPGGYTPHILAMNPNGRTIAHIRWAESLDAHLVRYEVDEADLRYRDLLSGVGRMQGVAWSKDGRIFFGSSPGPDTWRIMQIPAEGGHAQFTGLEVKGLMFFDLSPDGSRIVFDGTEYKISPPGSYTLEPVTTQAPAPGGRGARGTPPTPPQ